MQLTTSWKEEGLQQGLQQGLHDGEVTALKRLLHRHFQVIPEEIVARIDGALPEQLEQWIEKTLDAATLDDVFKTHSQTPPLKPHSC